VQNKKSDPPDEPGVETAEKVPTEVNRPSRVVVYPPLRRSSGEG